MTDENNEIIEVDETVDVDESALKKSLKNQLEVMLGLPLTPKLFKQVDMDFDYDKIIVTNYPVLDINVLKINNEIITDYMLVEDEGIIYLDHYYRGKLFLEYVHCLPEEEYEPLLDLMVEYELDNNPYKDATSISEKNVSISFNKDMGKGALIQSMIQDLKLKYSCVVEMI